MFFFNPTSLAISLAIKIPFGVALDCDKPEINPSVHVFTLGKEIVDALVAHVFYLSIDYS